jgi:hypothetical protein
VLYNARRYYGTDAHKEISGFGFQPDFLWIKCRSGAQRHVIYDSVKGFSTTMQSESSAAESTSYGNTVTTSHVNNPTVDGFVYDHGSGSGSTPLNSGGHSYVAWGWKAGEGVTTSGTTSGGGTDTAFTRSVNTAGGFSIIKYVGNGTDGHNIPHGLTAAPNFVLVKNRTTTNDWIVFHSSTGSNGTTYRGILSGTATFIADGGSYWSNDFPDATNVTLGSLAHINGNTNNLIMHAWHAVAGVSAFGSYAGNNDANGAFVNLGFYPRWLMVKCTTHASNWIVWDSARSGATTTGESMLPRLRPNTAEVEADNANNVEWYLSGSDKGWRPKTAEGGLNGSGRTYIYMAFA